jgi:hypothetical protein
MVWNSPKSSRKATVCFSDELTITDSGYRPFNALSCFSRGVFYRFTNLQNQEPVPSNLSGLCKDFHKRDFMIVGLTMSRPETSERFVPLSHVYLQTVPPSCVNSS